MVLRCPHEPVGAIIRTWRQMKRCWPNEFGPTPSEDPMSVEFLGGTRTGAGGQPLPFSPAVKAGPFVFVSGQVAIGDNGEILPGGIEAQTRQTPKNVEKALALAGDALKDVVQSSVWPRYTRGVSTINRAQPE